MIGKNVFSKDEKVFVQFNPNQEINSFIVPKGVERIDNCAFEDSNLESVIIPNTVTEIGELAFGFNYELTNISLPNSIKHIGSSCFSQCSNLENIILPNNLEKIEASTFEDSGIKNIIIPKITTGTSKKPNALTAYTIQLPSFSLNYIIIKNQNQYNYRQNDVISSVFCWLFSAPLVSNVYLNT